jgi:hypothetical protein
MEPILIEIPHGEDIVEGIIQCAQRREANITVLSASGHVPNVTLRALNFPLEGPFYMTSSYFSLLLSLSLSSFSQFYWLSSEPNITSTSRKETIVYTKPNKRETLINKLQKPEIGKRKIL